MDDGEDFSSILNDVGAPEGLEHASDINLHVNRITLASRSGGLGGEVFAEEPGMGIERPMRRLCTNQCERVFIKITTI